MTQDQRTVRQWLSLYRAGAFESKELDDQRTAGWRRFPCRFDALPGRLRQMAPMIAHIQEPFILDHYTVLFENVKCPNRKAVYDRAQFRPLDAGREDLAFHVDFKNPDEPEKWVLYTERFGLEAPEFGCTGALEMARYINAMTHELEQGVRPPFLDEQAAAVRYALGCGAFYSSVCRVGDHSYRFWDRNGQKKTLHVARRLEDVPPDFQVSKAKGTDGLYVYCPEDMKKPLSSRPKDAGKTHKKRKELER